MGEPAALLPAGYRTRKKLWLLAGIAAIPLVLLVVLLVYFLVLRPSRSVSASAVHPSFCPTDISASIQLTNNLWQALNPNPPPGPNSLTWGNCTYFSGDLVAYTATGIDSYYTYALDWAISNKFSFDPHGPNGPDILCVGYNYITLYLLDPNHPPNYILPIDTQILKLINSPDIDIWTWVDALHMSMPQFAHLGVIRNDTRYFDKMYALFNYTKRAESGSGLWDSSKGLWWRDKGFVGQNVYWSRGNGWAIAALAKVLDVLPRSDPHYEEYVSTLQEMGPALVATQQPDGFWYVNLGNSSDYPGPETSGTMLFVYGITWGINHGIFDASTYGPIVAKAWNSVIDSALGPNGHLMYIQGPGFQPSSKQPITPASTWDFGVGSFLLAGSELVELCGK